MDSRVLASWPAARVLRLALSEGEVLGARAAPADSLVVCLCGRVTLRRNGRSFSLAAGDGLPLTRGDAHAIHALEASALLLVLAG